MAAARILIVDDEPAMLENCDRLLSREGYECTTMADATHFRELLSDMRPDALLLDLRMPDVDGMTLLTVALADDPSLPVIIMTAYATVASAVHAIREGAFDYLTKPFQAEQLLVAIERAVRHGKLMRENRALRERVARETGTGGIVGSSPAMEKLLRRVEQVATADASVLIVGESGTGKEIIARRIHALSERSAGPFVPVDCAALPEGLVESELFGHERGAFTGADKQREGLLETARGGTIFLDEFTELSLGLQAKLLRALEERKVRHLGGTALIDLDIRVVTATNVDVEAAVAEGSLREDLYYRLNVVRIHVPPLRARRGDVALLAQAFLVQYSAQEDKDVPAVSHEVWRLLEKHTWPGNVRELKNLIERMVVLDEDGILTLADLPELLRPGIPPTTAAGEEEAESASYEQARNEALRAFKSSYVQRVLAASDGNVSKAARAAGVSRRTVHRWLAELSGSEEGTP